jgi:serine protease
VLTVTDNGGATGVAKVVITVSPNPSLNAPTSLTGAAGRGSVTLKWTNNSTNQTGIYIERAPSGTTSFVRVGTAGATATSFTNSVSKGTYLYRVQAFNATNVSAYSNTVSVRVTK